MLNFVFEKPISVIKIAEKVILKTLKCIMQF